MQLTKFTDLGLRVLMYVSQHDRSKPITISEIATQFNIPRNHLIKVVTFLNKTGWIQTTRGPNGGLRLGTDSMSLKLGHVIRILEGSESLVNCQEPPCPLSGQCGLKGALDQGLNAFYHYMDSYTLSDVIQNRTANVIVHLQHTHLAGLH
ncbi:Rrf2 family transcriptional regulator [Methylobacillus gramineus]|uniref:RrF2 family transcriptional regulator n=1 Tax=Methylobacillus gramineus TaxID=755169 RepID=UPI001CFF6911|nr:Rrf2 family transcriptional regulator [Methylobacillus gramineus]MCB5185052.1 Rrf2 family transcriptional regulator [Methylobacillus gramineus]